MKKLYIVAVKKTLDGNIVWVEVKDNLQAQGNGVLQPVPDIVSLLKAKEYKIFTAIRESNLSVVLSKGAEVEIFNLKGKEWIRTVPDSDSRNNLDNLPNSNLIAFLFSVTASFKK